MFPKLKLLNGVSNLPHLNSSGTMSQVFTGKFKNKQVIVIINKPNAEQKRQKIWNKPIIVQQILKNSKIPFPKIHRAGFEKGYYVVIQQRLDGKVAGNRTLQQKFKDTCKNKEVHNKILKLLKQLHKIQLKKFGPLINKNGGKYKTWQSYLAAQVNYAFSYLNKHSNYFALSQKEKSKILDLISTANYKDKPCLLHGDMINYSNILVKNNKITGIVDFEWSLAGDPAYDLAFDTGLDISNYSTNKDFLKRKSIYTIIWLLWGCTVHPSGKVGVALYRELCRRLHIFKL